MITNGKKTYPARNCLKSSEQRCPNCRKGVMVKYKEDVTVNGHLIYYECRKCGDRDIKDVTETMRKEYYG